MDKRHLQKVCQNIFGVSDTQADYARDEIVLALTSSGIDRFSELLPLTEEDISKLIVPRTGATAAYELPLAKRRKIAIFLQFYHEKSRKAGAQVDPETLDRDEFDDFRCSKYDPKRGIIPWGVNVDAGKTSPEEHAMQTWTKTIRPSAKDFKIFKDGHKFSKYKPHFESSLKACGLEHTVDTTHAPQYPDLYRKQQDWVFKVMEDNFEAPAAKAIVRENRTTMNTATIWHAICTHYKTHMNTELRSQTLSTYMTSARLNDGRWRGSQELFIRHFQEQAREYNEISDTDYSSGQLCQFLYTAVAGVPNLQSVWTNNIAARKAAGINTKPTFEEYVQLLSNAAAVHDSGNSIRRSARQVNTHEFYGDEYDQDIYDANVHDMNTEVETLLQNAAESNNNSGNGFNRFQPRGPPRKIMLDANTWSKLPSNDRRAWISLSEPGKDAILQYGNVRAKNFPPKSGAPSGYKANAHETDMTVDESAGDEHVEFEQKLHIFDDELLESNQHSVTFDTSKKTQQKTAPQGILKNSTNTKDGKATDPKKQDIPKETTKKNHGVESLLHLATTKESKSKKSASTFINQMLSQPSPATSKARSSSKQSKQESTLDFDQNFTEITMERSELTPMSCDTHEGQYSDAEDDVLLSFNMHEMSFDDDYEEEQTDVTDGQGDTGSQLQGRSSTSLLSYASAAVQTSIDATRGILSDISTSTILQRDSDESTSSPANSTVSFSAATETVTYDRTKPPSASLQGQKKEDDKEDEIFELPKCEPIPLRSSGQILRSPPVFKPVQYITDEDFAREEQKLLNASTTSSHHDRITPSTANDEPSEPLDDSANIHEDIPDLEETDIEKIAMEEQALSTYNQSLSPDTENSTELVYRPEPTTLHKVDEQPMRKPDPPVNSDEESDPKDDLSEEALNSKDDLEAEDNEMDIQDDLEGLSLIEEKPKPSSLANPISYAEAIGKAGPKPPSLVNPISYAEAGISPPKPKEIQRRGAKQKIHKNHEKFLHDKAAEGEIIENFKDTSLIEEDDDGFRFPKKKNKNKKKSKSAAATFCQRLSIGSAVQASSSSDSGESTIQENQFAALQTNQDPPDSGTDFGKAKAD